MRDLAGRPVAGALLDVWQSDEEGLYDVQRAGDEHRARGRLRTGDRSRGCAGPLPRAHCAAQVKLAACAGSPVPL